MQNKAMERKLATGAAIDVATLPRLGPYYLLVAAGATQEARDAIKQRIEDKDLCDGKTEDWIWSVGELEEDVTFERNGVTVVARAGAVLASTQGDLYQREGVRCLWLR